MENGAKNIPANDKLFSLISESIHDLSDADAISECMDLYGGGKEAESVFSSALDRAILKTEVEKTSNKNIYELPLKFKQLLIDLVNRSRHLTLAARNKNEEQLDVDQLLTDLIDLDAIDEKGNIL